MADNDPIQIDLTPLQGVFSSMQSSLDRQTSLLQDVLRSQERERRSNARASRLSSVATAGSSAVNSTGNILQGVGSAASGIGGGLGSIFSGLGNLGRGGGIGLLAGLFALSAVDTNQIKTSVETLLSIGEGYESRLDFFIDTGLLAGALLGLGFGLKQLAIGAGANVLVEWVAGVAGQQNWAQTVKDNVETLLSIGNITGIAQGAQLLFSGAAVPLALTGLGIGLSAFGIGQALVGLGQWLTDTEWAENVKDNVLTLLSISDGITDTMSNLLESNVGFPAMMTGLSVGLGVFAVGEALTGLAQFTTRDGWAIRVKNNVLTLLEISDLSWGDTARFVSNMINIAAGLAIFGGGAAIAGLGSVVAEAGTSFTLEQMRDGIDYLSGNSSDAPANWAESVVNSIETLMRISTLSWGDTAAFAGHMTAIAAGLAVFGVGAGVAGVGNAVAEAVAGIRFFTRPEDSDLPAGWVNQIVHDITSLSNMDFSRAGTFRTGMTDIALGLVALFGAQGMGAVTGLLAELTSFVAWLLPGGSDGETPLQQMANDISHVTDIIDQETVNLFTEFTGALENLFDLFNRIATTGVSAGASARIGQLVEDLGNIISVMEDERGNGLLNGGTWYAAGQIGWSDRIEFGRGLRYYLSPEGEGDLQVLSEGATVFRRALSGLGDMGTIVPGGAGASVTTAPTATVTPTEDYGAILTAAALAASQAAQSAAAAAEAAVIAAQNAGGTVTNNTNNYYQSSDPSRPLLSYPALNP